jgi:hypothetical protein
MQFESTRALGVSTQIIRPMIAQVLLGLTAFTAHAKAAEPWKPTGELARVKFDKDCGLILLPVTVNGEAHHFLLDTNCTGTLVDRTLTKDLRPLSKRRVDTVGREIQIPTYSAPRLEVGELTCDTVTEVGAIDLKPFRDAVGYDFRGVIGMDALRSTLLHIDFDNALVVLCDAKADHQPPGAPTPLILDDQLSPKILVKPRGVDAAVFQIDTGMNGTGHMNKELTNELRRTGEIALTGITHQSLRGDSSVATVDLQRCLELEVAGHRHANLVFSEGENTLGLGFLRRHRVTLDFVRGQAYFEPGSIFPLRDRSDYGGIVVAPDVGIRHVVPGSIGDKAGLRPSDQLMAVGDARVRSTPWPAISKLLTTPRVEALTITVLRDGREVSVEIPGG